MRFALKNVVVYGAGVSGISAYELCREKGAKAIVYDDNPLAKRATSSKGVFDGADMIILSPGVNPDQDFLLDARLENVLVISELELASRVCVAEQIAITGTNGKTTTTLLVDHILKRAGLHSHAVGNIGTPFSYIADKLDATETCVIEASSYQLENCPTFSPDIAVLLNIKPDHLARHKGIDGYVHAKSNIFLHQGEGDYLVYNADDTLVCNAIEGAISQKVPFSKTKVVQSGAYISSGFICFRGVPIVALEDIDFKGDELDNVLASVCVCMLKGVSAFNTASAITDFARPKYRRQLVKIVNGIYVYNDSKATNISACLCACKSVENCILMLGGMLGDENFDTLFANLSSSVKGIVAQGENAYTIKDSARKYSLEVSVENTLEDATKKAFEMAKELNAESILFSPASKSFDLYKNFEERGKRFDEEIAKIARGI